MEIDELKKLWINAPLKRNDWSGEQLTDALRGKSKSVVDRMKKSVRFEMGLTISSIALLVWVVLANNGPLRWLMVLMLATYSSLSLYFLAKLRLLARFDFASSNLQDNLADLIQKMKAFLSFYGASHRWSLGIFYLLGLVTIYLELGPERTEQFALSIKGMLFFLVFTGPIVASYFLMGWYLQKLYGNHLQRLKSLLAELNMPES